MPILLKETFANINFLLSRKFRKSHDLKEWKMQKFLLIMHCGKCSKRLSLTLEFERICIVDMLPWLRKVEIFGIKISFMQLNGQSALGHQIPLWTNQKAGRQSAPMVIIMLLWTDDCKEVLGLWFNPLNSSQKALLKWVCASIFFLPCRDEFWISHCREGMG